MDLNLRQKTTIFLLVLVLAVGGFATYFHVQSMIEARFEELETRAYSMAQFVGLVFTDQMLKDVPVSEPLQIQMDVWMGEMPRAKYLEVYNSAGEIIYFLSKNDATGPELSSEEFRRAMATEEIQTSRLLPEEMLLDSLIPIRLFRTDFGLVRLGYDTSHFREERQRIIRLYGAGGTILILLIFLFSNRLASGVIGRIESLEKVALQLGSGDLEARANINSGDELERLGDTFNRMACKLQDRIDDLQTLQEISRRISTKLRPEDLRDHIVNILHEYWELHHINLMLYDLSRQKLEIKAGMHIKPGKSWDRNENRQLFERLKKIKDYEHLQDVSSASELKNVFGDTKKFPLKEGLIFRLETDTFDLGFLLLGRETKGFEPEEISLLTTLSNEIKIAMENARHYLRAITDDLTDLYNRSFFDIQLKKELMLDKPVSLLMLDIDNFKKYNDSFGHPAGDEVLKDLAATFENQVRTTDTEGTARRADLVCRYGGEEFAIILPNTRLRDAETVAERVRSAVKKEHDFEVPITVSIGVAQAREDDTPKKLTARADRALYQAKEQGKDQVCVEE